MLQKIIDTVQRAGEIVLSAQDIAAHAHEKTSPADLVTAYDIAVEEFLKKELPPLQTGSVFFGEEETANVDPARGWAFIVDPIDGTTNFVRGFGLSAISVALAKDSVVQIGVVYNPFRSELFTATLGGGSFLNGQAIHVSRTPLEKGIFGMGTAPYRRDLLPSTLHLTEQLMHRGCDFRRTGAAALDLCYVACGRTDAFFEYSLCPWDYAAASLMITEAGGYVSSLDGSPLCLTADRTGIWASNAVNRHIIDELEI